MKMNFAEKSLSFKICNSLPTVPLLTPKKNCFANFALDMTVIIATLSTDVVQHQGKEKGYEEDILHNFLFTSFLFV